MVFRNNYKRLITLIVFGLISYGSIGQQKEIVKINFDLELIKLSGNAYIHVSYINHPTWGRVSSNGMIFIQNQKAFLFDTPMSDTATQSLVNWVENNLSLKFIGFVPNHWHIDCIGGLKFIQNKGIKTYANQMTIDKAQDEKLPVPEIGFSDSLTINFEDKDIKCYYFGAAHTMDNIVVYLPSEKILFAGCIAKEINSKTLGNIVDGDVNEYPKTITKVLSLFPDAEIVIPGHGNYGGRELLYHTLDLINTKK